MKFSKLVDIIKELLFVLYNLTIDIVRNVWEPFYTVTIKILLMSLVIWTGVHLIPHHLDFLNNISYFGWCTLIFVYNLVTLRYSELSGIEETDKETVEVKDEDGPPEIQILEEDDIVPYIPPNVVKKNAKPAPNTSTRE